MTIIQLSITLGVAIVLIAFISPLPVDVHGLGSGSTIAISHGSGTVCGILAGETPQSIQCYRGGQVVAIEPNISYEAISGGQNFVCGLRSGGASFLCWDTGFAFSSFVSKRIYYSEFNRLRDLTVGDDHVCAVENATGVAKCWRGMTNSFPSPQTFKGLLSITSGRGFSCGISSNGSRVQCWGQRSIGAWIQQQFQNISMSSLVAGDSHVCGLRKSGTLICRGDNSSGQLDVPSGSRAFEFSSLALGDRHSCAIRRWNGSVVCWGGRGEFDSNVTEGISFELMVAGTDFTCGLTSRNLSVICWGPGWSDKTTSGNDLPFPKIIPGPCTQASCTNCGVYPDSQTLCFGSTNICKPCQVQIPLPMPLPRPRAPPAPSSPSQSSSITGNRVLLAFVIIGSAGVFSGICTIIYCLWSGNLCFGHKKVHDSVPPTNAGGNTSTSMLSGPPSRSSTMGHLSSRSMRRQRSGTSSKRTEKAEEFSLSELAVATNNFSLENKLGAGSFGTVYKGKLADGREVAIKRGDTGLRTKKFQEKESAFESELAFLSRLHHKHLVRLVGYCEEMDERLLVYEYMKNGALYDHLHSKDNVDKSSSLLNTWKMRIKISLDAARGIEYLHNYAVPPIIHRDIKSSNILLDDNWTARVSDFGLSLMGPDTEREHTTTKAAGTVGYMDPEYYGLNVLTTKSDVYGLGVVLLEILTGKRAIFKNGEGGGQPTSVVDYAVPKIMAGELGKVMDVRVGVPESNEAEAVDLVAYTAIHCVNLEAKERPSMSDIVSNLEKALSLFDDSHGSISTTAFSIISE